MQYLRGHSKEKLMLCYLIRVTGNLMSTPFTQILYRALFSDPSKNTTYQWACRCLYLKETWKSMRTYKMILCFSKFSSTPISRPLWLHFCNTEWSVNRSDIETGLCRSVMDWLVLENPFKATSFSETSWRFRHCASSTWPLDIPAARFFVTKSPGQKAGVRSFIVQITFLITINDNYYAQWKTWPCWFCDFLLKAFKIQDLTPAFSRFKSWPQLFS